ncbi:glycoside hydrolase superfamily [Panaeolus papilionaceus]|nr:glycoside hydrolase superfamily [Panaeolus papilionaceus]
MASLSVSILIHTTLSTPRPHVLYVVEVTNVDGAKVITKHRYSEFCALKDAFKDAYPFPPKPSFTSSVVPGSWVDDKRIEERKLGLEIYLNNLCCDEKFSSHPVLLVFLGLSCLPLMSEKRLEDGELVKPIAGSYCPSWSKGIVPPNKIDFSKFDVIFYAFACPTQDGRLKWEDSGEATLKELVKSARTSGHPAKIVLSVGGWGGSTFFSEIMASAVRRSKLLNEMVNCVNFQGLDGIDIDWEYPNAPGDGHPHSPADAANFLIFVKALRTALGPARIISAAVPHEPWLGADGAPLKNVSEFAAVMSYVNIMNYDVFTSSSHPGTNAPLGDLCGSSNQPKASAHAALSQWTKAGFPTSKLLLGLPLYGYVSCSTAKKLSSSGTPGLGHLHRRFTPPPQGMAPQGDVSRIWGQQIPFSQILAYGILTKRPDGTYTATNGYTSGWDNCSDTPFAYNPSRTTVDVRATSSSAENKHTQ